MNYSSKYSKYYEKIEEGWFVHQPMANLKRLYLEVTARCNLSCIMCARNNWSFEPGDMSYKLFEKIMKQLDDFPDLNEVVLGGFGEPFLHTEIVNMFRSLKEKGLKVIVTTNGMLLNDDLATELIESKVDELIVSFDGVSEKKFAMIRENGDLSSVKGNIKNLNRIKKEYNTIFPRINIEFVAMKKNQDELEKLPQLARETEAMFVLVSNLLPHNKEMTEQILYGEDYGESFSPMLWASPTKGFATMCTVDFPRMKWGAFKRCRFVERKAAVVDWEGKVAPCYALLHDNRYYVFGREKNIKAHYFGDLNKEDLLSVWLSRDYTTFRNRVRFFSFPSCVDCSISDNCGYPLNNEDCWGNSPSCTDCLWAQDIIRCP